MAEPRIDPEFQKLLPPLAADEFAELEGSILDEGIREPFVVWLETGILLDGHNRLAIAKERDQPWPAPTELSFADKTAAEKWIITNQLARRNLTPEWTSFLRGLDALTAPREDGKRTDTSSNDLTRLQELAEEHGVTRQQLHNDAKFAEAVENIEKVAEGFRDKALGGDLTKKAVAEVARLEADEREEVARQIVEGEAASVKDARKKFKREQKAQEATEAVAAMRGERPFEVRHGDFRAAFADVEDGSIALVFTDPPWDDATLTDTWPALCEWADRVLVEGGSLVSYAGHNALPFMLSTATDLRYWWTLAMVLPSGKNLPGKFVMAQYRPLVWYVKGGRRNSEYLPDVATRKTTSTEHKGWHEWAQTPEMPRACIDRLTTAGELVADPFLGGATTGAVAIDMARRFIGAEIDKEVAEVGLGRLEQVWRDAPPTS